MKNITMIYDVTEEIEEVVLNIPCISVDGNLVVPTDLFFEIEEDLEPFCLQIEHL